MLLEAIIKNTWEDHPDFNNLKQAHSKVEAVRAPELSILILLDQQVFERKQERTRANATAHDKSWTHCRRFAGTYLRFPSLIFQNVVVPKRLWLAKYAGQIKQKHALIKKSNNGFLTVFNDAIMITHYSEKEGEKLKFLALMNETELAKTCMYE